MAIASPRLFNNISKINLILLTLVIFQILLLIVEALKGFHKYFLLRLFTNKMSFCTNFTKSSNTKYAGVRILDL